MSTIKLQDDVALDVSPKTKQTVGVIHSVVTLVFVLGTVSLIIVWIWEELAKSDMYLANLFLDDPLFGQSRYVLMLGYWVCLILLVILQCCIQVESGDKTGGSRGKRIIWTITALLLFLTFIGSSLMAFFYRKDLDDLDTVMNEMINEDFLNETSNGYTEAGMAYNRVQGQLGCCGINAATDYDSTGFLNESGLEFPYSCCELNSDAKGNENVTEDDVVDWVQCQARNADHFHANGCHDLLYDACRPICTETVIIGFCCAVLLFIAMIARLATEAYFDRKHQRYLDDLEKRQERHAKGHSKSQSKVMPLNESEAGSSTGGHRGGSEMWVEPANGGPGIVPIENNIKLANQDLYSTEA